MVGDEADGLVVAVTVVSIRPEEQTAVVVAGTLQEARVAVTLAWATR